VCAAARRTSTPLAPSRKGNSRARSPTEGVEEKQQQAAGLTSFCLHKVLRKNNNNNVRGGAGAGGGRIPRSTK
jgi:hypothetical protein